jgi:hypothetical protein
MELSWSSVTVTDPFTGVLSLSCEGAFCSLPAVSARMSWSSWSHSGMISLPHLNQIFRRCDALIMSMWYGMSVLLGVAIYCGHRVSDEDREHTQQLA